MAFKPEVGQSLRWSFAMQVARTFSLRTEDALRLLEMVKNYDKDRSELMEGLHGKHCSEWLTEEGRYCDRPATVCNLGKYRCAEHDPLRVPFVGEYRRLETTAPAEGMDEPTFNTMSAAFQALEAMEDADLQQLLMPSNRMEALLQHMRVKFGEAAVSEWLKECGKRGIVT